MGRKLKLKTLKLPLLLKKIRGRKLQKKLNTLHVFNFPSTNKKHTYTPLNKKTTILFLLCLSKRSHWGIPIDTVTLYYRTLFILCIYTTPKACSKFSNFIHTLLTQNCFLVESQFFTTNATFLNFFFSPFLSTDNQIAYFFDGRVSEIKKNYNNNQFFFFLLFFSLFFEGKILIKKRINFFCFHYVR